MSAAARARMRVDAPVSDDILSRLEAVAAMPPSPFGMMLSGYYGVTREESDKRMGSTWALVRSALGFAIQRPLTMTQNQTFPRDNQVVFSEDSPGEDATKSATRRREGGSAIVRLSFAYIRLAPSRFGPPSRPCLRPSCSLALQFVLRSTRRFHSHHFLKFSASESALDRRPSTAYQCSLERTSCWLSSVQNLP